MFAAVRSIVTLDMFISHASEVFKYLHDRPLQSVDRLQLEQIVCLPCALHFPVAAYDGLLAPKDLAQGLSTQGKDVIRSVLRS